LLLDRNDEYDAHVSGLLYVAICSLTLTSQQQIGWPELTLLPVRIHGTAAAYPLNGLSMGVFLWKNAITIPALLNILLYFSAKHLTVLGSKNGVSAERTEFHTKDSWRLQGNALKHLNNLLQDPKRAVTQPTIITIACFITIEVCIPCFDKNKH
jgi:hypothetical protein